MQACVYAHKPSVCERNWITIHLCKHKASSEWQTCAHTKSVHSGSNLIHSQKAFRSLTQAGFACQGFLLPFLVILHILCWEFVAWQGLLTSDTWEHFWFLATISWTARQAYQASSMPSVVVQYILIEKFLRTRRQAFPFRSLENKEVLQKI